MRQSAQVIKDLRLIFLVTISSAKRERLLVHDRSLLEATLLAIGLAKAIEGLCLHMRLSRRRWRRAANCVQRLAVCCLGSYVISLIMAYSRHMAQDSHDCPVIFRALKQPQRFVVQRHC